MRPPTRALTAIALSAAVAVGVVGLCAQAAAPATSPSKARELVGLLAGKKMTVFAVREPTAAANRFVAVMLVPDVQLLVVSAAYSRPSDIEYRLYQKDYMAAFRDLSAGREGAERFSVEDILADGLVAVPVKNSVPDSVTAGQTRSVFDGPADPRKRNDKRMPADAYQKAFGDADRRYAGLLDLLIAELKKPGVLAAPVSLR